MICLPSRKSPRISARERFPAVAQTRFDLSVVLDAPLISSIDSAILHQSRRCRRPFDPESGDHHVTLVLPFRALHILSLSIVTGIFLIAPKVQTNRHMFMTGSFTYPPSCGTVNLHIRNRIRNRGSHTAQRWHGSREIGTLDPSPCGKDHPGRYI